MISEISFEINIEFKEVLPNQSELPVQRLTQKGCSQMNVNMNLIRPESESASANLNLNSVSCSVHGV